MLGKLVRFVAATAEHRARYGVVRGLIMAYQLRSDYAQPPGRRYRVTVPGWGRPVLLRAGTSDVAVFMQVVFRGDMDVPLTSTPSIIVDAGAHVGLSTLKLAHRFAHARIISLEPDPENYAMLRRNTARLARVTALNRALWSGPARLGLRNPQATPCSYQFTDEVESGSAANVAAVGVADLMSEFSLERIDLLKIDIEGAEVEVFSAGDRSWLQHVSTLVVETHDRLRPGCTDSILEALGCSWSRSEHGEYSIFTRGPDPSSPAPRPDVAAAEAAPPGSRGAVQIP